MFGIGFFEIVIIAVAALVLVGPKKLPELMRQAGKLFVQVRRTTNDVRSTFDQIIKEAEDDLRKKEIEDLRNILSPVPTNKIVDAVSPDDVNPAHHVDAPDGSHHYNPYDANYFKKEETEHTDITVVPVTAETVVVTGDSGDKK